MGGICPTDCTDLHGTKGIFIRQLRQLERQLKSIIPALSLLSYLLSVLSFNISRVSVPICVRLWEVIYLLALRAEILLIFDHAYPALFLSSPKSIALRYRSLRSPAILMNTSVCLS